MPSSTKIPMTTIIPNKDIKFIVISNSPANINIPKKEIGILKATQNANLILRKSDKKIKTKNIPIPPFSRSKLVLCFKAME